MHDRVSYNYAAGVLFEALQGTRGESVYMIMPLHHLNNLTFIIYYVIPWLSNMDWMELVIQWYTEVLQLDAETEY